MKLTQLDGLLAFVTVARQRSFTAAAAALEVTPPAVSQAVRQLEERLGVRLLNRSTRSVSLTEAGDHFFTRVSPAVAELLEASAGLDAYRDGVTGLLRLNAPMVVHQVWLRPVLADFLSAHPGVKVELALQDGFVDIVAEGYDAGIRLGESVQADMVSVPLTRAERIAIVASPDYAARHGLPQDIESLHRHACIRYRFPGSGAIFRWEVLRAGNIVEVEVDGPLTVSDSITMAQAALDGIGIAYTFERQVRADIEAGQLLRVLPDICPTLSGFHLYYPGRRQMPNKLRAFIDHCRSAEPTP